MTTTSSDTAGLSWPDSPSSRPPRRPADLPPGTRQLIAFRLIQGAGAAVMIPQVLSRNQRHFADEVRIRTLGAYSAVLATGAAAGQVVGGVLVSADLFGAGRRPVFLVNVPIGLVLLVLGIRVLPGEPAHG